MNTTIFGREPAAWIGIIEAALTVLMAFALGVSQQTFGPIMAVVVAAFAVYTAYATHATMLAYIVGLAKAIFILAAVYGFTLTDMQTGALISLITVVAALWNRNQTFPVAYPPPAVPSGDNVVLNTNVATRAVPSRT